MRLLESGFANSHYGFWVIKIREREEREVFTIISSINVFKIIDKNIFDVANIVIQESSLIFMLWIRFLLFQFVAKA